MVTITLYLMLNNQFLGDRQQVEAIEAKIIQKFRSKSLKIKSIEYQDNEPGTLSLLAKDLTNPETELSVIILSGSHGFQFITKKEVQELVQRHRKKKLFVLWVGHQDPGLIKQQSLFDRIALPIHVVEDKLVLRETFKERLIAMQGVPNTLQEQDLVPALKKWNIIYPAEAIADAPEGAIGVFLGGSAPKPDNGPYLHETLDAIRARGSKFGALAKRQNKKLYIVNGPRTGKFYPESPDPNDPIIRQYNRNGWIHFAKLTDEQRRMTANQLVTMPDSQRKTINQTLAHAHGSPLDPETEAFLAGISDSGLDKSQYQVFDFKFTPGEPTKSAYVPVIAALYHSKDTSIACYSGESISYAEIAHFIPNTYAFRTGTMNAGHEGALRRFSQELHMVRILHLDKTMEAQPIDFNLKAKSVQDSSQQDAIKVVDALASLLTPKLQKRNLSFGPSSKIVTYGLIAGAVAVGLFFLYRSSQKSPDASIVFVTPKIKAK